MSWVPVVGVVFAVIAAAAGLVGYFRANVSKSTIELYREDNEALRARLKTVEEQVAADAIQLKALKAARDYLASVLTQAEQIKLVLDAQQEMATVLNRIATKVGA